VTKSEAATAETVPAGHRVGRAVRVCAAGLAAIAGGLCALPAWAITVNGAMVFDYEPGESSYDQIAAWVASGHAGGDWDGEGICSTAAAADPQGITGLGVLDNDDPHPNLGGKYELEGEALTIPGEDDFTQVLVMYTYYGDANLDGQVSFADLNLLITGWENQPPGGIEDPRWGVGDFNYDGQVSFADLNLLITGWENQGGRLPEHGAHTPEPATLAGLMIGLGGLVGYLRRRWRR